VRPHASAACLGAGANACASPYIYIGVRSMGEEKGPCRQPNGCLQAIRGPCAEHCMEQVKLFFFYLPPN